LKQFGCVTANDLSDEVLARARVRVPQVHFIAGDFMSLRFEPGAYDVVVAVEVLSHVADQPGFVAKAARLLRPGGLFMLATQNRPVLERFNSRPPPSPGPLRNWVDRHELHALLAPHFDILELFSLTPQANRGIMRVVNSHAFNVPIRMVAGSRVERLKEKMWLGWTLMALSRKLP
jgi:2-polyprenyl-3-methyl-5-hydroxy-6-metoxy-1,4-benzoquinol methylase